MMEKKSASLLILRPLMMMDKEIKVIRIYLQVEAHEGRCLSTAMLLKYELTDIVQNQVIVSVILQSQ